MNRQTDLNTYLYPYLHKQYCLNSQKLPISELGEKAIISCIYEDTHGKRLYLDDVIDHLQALSIKNNVSDDENVIEMINRLYSFQDYIKSLKKGSKGERFARKALERMTIPCNILENIELNYKDVQTENDIIVIAKTGVFVIEVKYSDNHMKITHDGFLLPIDHHYPSFNSKNVLDQVENERYAVRRTISDSLHIDEELLDKKVHSIVLFANKDKRLIDSSHSAKVKYCFNISSYISNFNDGIYLSDEEIVMFTKTLEEHKHEQEYEIDFDYDGLRKSLVIGIDIIENGISSHSIESVEPDKKDDVIKHTENQSATTNTKWNWDWKSASIGSVTTMFTIGAGLFIAKKYSILKG